MTEAHLKLGTEPSKQPKTDKDVIDADVRALLHWYDIHGRDLPWRRRWPDLAPAYHVFLSELMLQQTVVATVIPYFARFTKRWPDLSSLAASPVEDVLEAWSGLGYYARARNMHKAAQILTSDYNGAFPDTADMLIKLPGIGPYTAGAIAAFAFDKPAIVIDGNIERVLSRYFGMRTELPALKADIAAIYPEMIPATRRSDFPQALMDLASQICQPKKAGCDICPLSGSCVASRWNDPTILPVKPAKTPKPVRVGTAFVLTNEEGDVAVFRRAEKGLLGGTLAFPSSGWDKSFPEFDWLEGATLNAKAPITHVFTHFRADIEVFQIEWQKQTPLPEPFFWTSSTTALPSLMAKILKSALNDQKRN